MCHHGYESTGRCIRRKKNEVRQDGGMEEKKEEKHEDSAAGTTAACHPVLPETPGTTGATTAEAQKLRVS